MLLLCAPRRVLPVSSLLFLIDPIIGHASLCYSADDKDPSTSPRGSPVASYVLCTHLPTPEHSTQRSLISPAPILRQRVPSMPHQNSGKSANLSHSSSPT